MIYTDPVAAAPAIAEQITAAQRILLLTHINPDGDAIGSLLGMHHYLRGLGKHSIPIASSEMPSYVMQLPGIEAVHVYTPGQALPDSDLVIMLDTASLPRVGKVYDEHAGALQARPLMIIDHHVTNDGVPGVNLINPQAASTCELLAELLHALGVQLTPAMASSLLLGLTTDTQSFQTSSTRPESLRVAADLIAAGADHGSLIRSLYFATPYSTVQLLGLSLAQVQRKHDLVWTIITQAMLQQTGAEDEAGDDVVNVLQRIDGVRASVLFKERADGSVKISLRAVPGLNMAAIARTWGGGGHMQAAGATLQMGLEAAQAEVLPRVIEALQQTMS